MALTSFVRLAINFLASNCFCCYFSIVLQHLLFQNIFLSKIRKEQGLLRPVPRSFKIVDWKVGRILLAQCALNKLL